MEPKVLFFTTKHFLLLTLHLLPTNLSFLLCISFFPLGTLQYNSSQRRTSLANSFLCSPVSHGCMCCLVAKAVPASLCHLTPFCSFPALPSLHLFFLYPTTIYPFSTNFPMCCCSVTPEKYLRCL